MRPAFSPRRRRHGRDVIRSYSWMPQNTVGSKNLDGMNIFFVMEDGTLVTPPLGTILPGITRASLITLARDAGMSVEEMAYSFGRWREDAATGRLREVFACGTAAVVAPIGSVRHVGGEFAIGGRSRRPGDSQAPRHARRNSERHTGRCLRLAPHDCLTARSRRHPPQALPDGRSMTGTSARRTLGSPAIVMPGPCWPCRWPAGADWRVRKPARSLGCRNPVPKPAVLQASRGRAV